MSAPVRASIMITCLGDMFFPEVGVTIVQLLGRLGVTVEFPAGQTCCGRPLFSGGYHVAVFDREALVESLEQTGVFLEARHEGPADPGRGAAIHVISGPSRTADIELTLRGVHGPNEVQAIFVDDPIRG